MEASSNPTASALLAESAWVRRLARALVRDPELAEDVAQETLVAALERGPVERASLRAWLNTVLRNRARRAHRSDARRRARERAVARAEATDSTDALVARAESHGRVVALVLALDEPYRSVLLQRYLEERTPTEIARQSGVPVATVKTRLQRGLARLRDEVGCAEGDRRPAWLVALAGVPRGSEVAAGVAVGGAIVTMKGPLISVVAIALACLVGVGVYALRAGEALEPSGTSDALAPFAGNASEGANHDNPTSAEESRTSVITSLEPGAQSAQADISDVTPLTGLVVDSLDRPIAGAQLSAFFQPGATYLSGYGAPRTLAREGQTDAQGRFELPLAAARAHELEVRANGFAPALRTECTGGMQLRVVLQRAAALRGTVVEAGSGDPVPGGFVRVFHGAWMVEVPVAAGGRFVLDELVPGEVGLLALPERHAVPRYRALEVEPGGVLEATLEVEPGLVVEGRITDARDGAPIAGAEVVSGRGEWKRVESAADGRYRLEGVEAVRRETLFVRAAGYSEAQLALDPARADAFDVELLPGRAVTGRVVSEDGLEVASGELIAWTSPYFEGGGARAELATTLDGEGRFRVEGLDPRHAYQLVVRAPGHATSYFPLASGDGDVDVGALRVVRAASIMGEVRAPDGRGVRALLELWPAADEPGGGDPIGLRSTRTDSQGAFALGDLGPGRYLLRAVAEGYPPLDDFELVLASGEPLRDLVVEIPAGLSLRGLVRDAEGTPVPDVHVEATPTTASARPSYTHATSDALGQFELTDLAAMPHRLTLSYGGAWTLRGEAVALDSLSLTSVEPGGAPLELVLPALDGRVAGSVFDADGAPVPAAYVFRARAGRGPGGGVLTDEAGRFELAVPSAGALELVARRTRHLSENEGNLTVSELQMGRDIAPAQLGEARLAGVAAGERALVLRLRP